MSTRTVRAARRRAEWTGQIVAAGTPKEPSYTDLTAAERLQAFTRLNARVWQAAGIVHAPLERSAWPGEVFELRRG